MPNDNLPEWEELLSCAARLQKIVPEAVLVGGTAAAVYAGHRRSRDADYVLKDLRERFDLILKELEGAAGWKTARVKRPVMILGSLDGIETGIRQLIREQPLETAEVEVVGVRIVVPTLAEILRIKASLILLRNATRDYLDFVALAAHMGRAEVLNSLTTLDRFYPQPNGESALQQLQQQLAQPLPFDLDAGSLPQYKNLAPRWHDWDEVKRVSADIAVMLLEEARA